MFYIAKHMFCIRELSVPFTSSYFYEYKHISAHAGCHGLGTVLFRIFTAFVEIQTCSNSNFESPGTSDRKSTS